MIRYPLYALLFFLLPSLAWATPLSCSELVDGLQGRSSDSNVDYGAILFGVLRTHPGLCPAVTTLPVAQATFLDWAESNPDDVKKLSASDCVAKAFAQSYAICHSLQQR